MDNWLTAFLGHYGMSEFALLLDKKMEFSKLPVVVLSLVKRVKVLPLNFNSDIVSIELHADSHLITSCRRTNMSRFGVKTF